MTISADLLDAVQQAIGSVIDRANPVSGGCVSSAYEISVPNGEKFFLKALRDAPPSFFNAEAEGLKRLGGVTGVRAPKVVVVEDGFQSTALSFIVLEFIEQGPTDEKACGMMLASLHRETARLYGLERNNYLGKTIQYNSQSDNWGDFFWNHRLLAQLELGKVAGWASERIQESVHSKKELILQQLAEGREVKPTLVHGDLWSGNVFYGQQGPFLIDPAIYYGDREVDLAFTELFGGFGRAFYEAYHRDFKPTPGFQRRRTIYNLYHLMNHANLFGGHYVVQIGSSLTAI